MTYKKLKAIKNHYQALYEICLNELHFENLQNNIKDNIIDQVYNLLDAGIPSNLIKKVIDNDKEKAIINKLIHSRLLFPNPEKLPKK